MGKMSAETRKKIDQLVATGYWGDRSAELGFRADFHCEYCGKDLLESLENYKDWQEDHIVPRSAGGKDEIDNLALSCRLCNMALKGRWNVLSELPKSASREALINAVKVHLEQKRQSEQQKLDKFRKIIA